MKDPTEFYSLIAQIIPVLLLVLVLETKTVRGMFTSAPFWRYFGLFCFGLVVFAEYRALRVVYTGNEVGWDSTIAWSALGFLAGAIGGVVFTEGQLWREHEHREREEKDE